MSYYRYYVKEINCKVMYICKRITSKLYCFMLMTKLVKPNQYFDSVCSFLDQLSYQNRYNVIVRTYQKLSRDKIGQKKCQKEAKFNFQRLHVA